MTGRGPAWSAIDGTAGCQHGMVTWSQSRAAGLAPTQIKRALSSARWQRVLPGVYATFTGPLTVEARSGAALLYAGPTSQLTARSALLAYGVRYLPPDDGRVHVLVPVDRQVMSRGFVRVHRTSRLPVPRWRDGVPCSPPEHAAVLACRLDVHLRDARALLAEVVQRRLTTVQRLAQVLATGHSAGSAIPRRVLEDLGAGCRSAPEMELRDLVRRSPVLARTVLWNHPVAIDGAVLVADACWLEVLLIVEVDSVDHHGLGWAPEHTARRRASLVAAGWTVLSVSPQRIRQDAGLVRQVEQTYRRLAMIHAA
jgi:hypothetical protein